MSAIYYLNGFFCQKLFSLQFNILADIGELKRGIIRERSCEGRMRALARDVKLETKSKLTVKEISQLINNYKAPGCSKTEIADHYGISRSSIYAENCQ